MEGLAWLLIKMSVLLALAGATYFALGWWLRGRQAKPSVEPAPSDDIERLKSEARAAGDSRDAAQREIISLRTRLAAAELEVRRLLDAQTRQAGVDEPDNLVLQAPVADATKPKPRKPRAKKTKA